MNIVLMRHIDYWIGTPLCFLFSIWDVILKIIGIKRERESFPKKALLIKLSEIGAIVLAYPLLKRLREEYKNTDLFFLTFEKNKEVFGVLPDTVSDKNIFTISEGPIWRFIIDTLKVIARMGRERIGLVFDLEFFSRFTAILSYLSGASKRVGFYNYTFEGLYRGNLLTHRVGYNPMLHIARMYLSMLQVAKKNGKLSPVLESKISDADLVLPQYASKPQIKEQIENRLKGLGVNRQNKIYLINPGEGNIPLREWPLENFISLSKRILEDPDNFIVIVGAKNPVKKEEGLFRACGNKRCVDFVGKTTISELMELCNISHTLITNDCGLAHLSSLTPIKKVILFGPESPKVFSPIGANIVLIESNLPCSPCLSALNHRESACRDNLCLKAIKPEKVYQSSILATEKYSAYHE